MTNSNYTVWVGGIEVNDTFMPKEEAEELANSYRKQGYRDVHIEKCHSIPPQQIKLKTTKK